MKYFGPTLGLPKSISDDQNTICSSHIIDRNQSQREKGNLDNIIPSQELYCINFGGARRHHTGLYRIDSKSINLSSAGNTSCTTCARRQHHGIYVWNTCFLTYLDGEPKTPRTKTRVSQVSAQHLSRVHPTGYCINPHAPSCSATRAGCLCRAFRSLPRL